MTHPPTDLSQTCNEIGEFLFNDGMAEATTTFSKSSGIETTTLPRTTPVLIITAPTNHTRPQLQASTCKQKRGRSSDVLNAEVDMIPRKVIAANGHIATHAAKAKYLNKAADALESNPDFSTRVGVKNVRDR